MVNERVNEGITNKFGRSALISISDQFKGGRLKRNIYN